MNKWKCCSQSYSVPAAFLPLRKREKVLIEQENERQGRVTQPVSRTLRIG